MSDPLQDDVALYRRALDGFSAVVARVPAGRWEAQSPCEDWKAIEVVGHVVGVQHYVRSVVTGAAMPASRPSPRESAGVDPAGAFVAAKAEVVAALAAPENLARVVATPFGQMPAGQFVGVLVLDALTHTWDLARATGLSVTLDPELVSICFARVRPMDEMLRRPGTFGAKREAPEGADEGTRLMAFLGRDVS
jgi:uncharacterized protein (TIGR03086 family)